MEKIYRLLPSLTTSEATHFLFQLTGTQVTADHLGQFCKAGHCNAYIACGSAKGEQHETMLSVCADDIQKLLQPEHMKREIIEGWDGRPEEAFFARLPLVAGAGWIYPIDNGPPKHEENLEWHVTSGPEHYQAIFKPADIQALADKMNGTLESQDAARIEDLRNQLEKAKLEAFIAEHYKSEALKGEQHVRQQLDQVTASRLSDSQTVKNLSQQLEQERTDRKIAEAEVSRLRQELEDEYNSRCAEEDDSAKEVSERHEGWLRKQHSDQPDNKPKMPATGLIFPYTTKSLEAAHAASLKYWQDLGSGRPPLQKQVTAFMVDRGVPARQASELAIAIKPDAIPNA